MVDPPSLFLVRFQSEPESAALRTIVIVTRDGAVIAEARNAMRGSLDPTAHAEVVAIREAATRLKTWRLTGTTMYVTIEPCSMCAGAIIQARVSRLVFGARDPKAGACGSVFNLGSNSNAGDIKVDLTSRGA